ncbi:MULTISPECIES: YraN family protein [unclassified Corynebacterium]|uniref:YraN family protein n=1 Tax=unclassified Corynebacterium TaxID=2624378 RepID=UPI0029CA95C5|nr:MULTISPECIES: YraN family protein [unclassified Corynebacterium]WPF65333.1 YraN family protein [Corynebacterium sp. 22KM0430]WPF67829.1 YraN family protein [Corynebacterium sp. 21KM1197]
MAKTTAMTLGQQGEAFAAAYYRERGARVLNMNVRCASGEIDLIAREPGGTVVFVEVKTRSGRDFGAAEAVDRRKLSRMRRAAAEWLRDKPWAQVRFDVLALTVVGRHRDSRCERLVFDAQCYEGVDSGARWSAESLPPG